MVSGEGDFAVFTHRSSSDNDGPQLEWEEGLGKGRPVRSAWSWSGAEAAAGES